MTTKGQSTLIFRFSIGASFALVALWSLFAAAAPITTGQLVNIRLGDGTTTASGTALPVTLDVYNVTYTGIIPTSVTLAQSIPLPTATSGTAPTSGNRYLTQGGTAGGEGGLLLSGDANYMTLAGYNQIVGGVTNPGTAGTEDRVVGFLNLSTGVVDTTTAFTGYSGSGPGATAFRGAYASNGTDVWAAASTGVRYGTAFTDNASTGISVDGTNNARRVLVYSGQLYQTEAANSRSGVEAVGTGTPMTAASATMSLLPGFSTTNGTYSPYDFWFADPNTLYIANDTGTNSGLQKWTFNGSTWALVFDYKIAAVNPGAAGPANGIKGLTGFLDAAGDAIMFATTVGANANLMLSLVDPVGNTSTSGVTETQLVDPSTAFSGGSLWNLRGLALAPGAAIPEPATLALLALGCLALVPLWSRRVR